MRRETTLFLPVLTVYLYTFHIGLSDHLRPRQHTDAQQETWIRTEPLLRGPNLTEATRQRQQQLRLEPGEQLPDFRGPKPDKTGLSWTVGGVSRQPLPPSSEDDDGYQADFTGFPGVQGKVLGLSFDSSPHFSEWLALQPLVQCDDNVMTFTASGDGLTQLLVYREGASPISLFQLPPYCGYSVRTSWSDLEMVVPYDACYITQENGSYVLPMLWWGSPLKLSCPVQVSTPAPSVFCSPYGMAVQIQGQEEDVAVLGFILNGGWGPLVSEDCAYRVQSSSGELALFISYSSPCITSGNGHHLQLLIDDQGYILSCPLDPQLPHLPSLPLAPGDPQSPYVPDPVNSAPTSPPPLPPHPPTQEQITQPPDYPMYPYPGFQYPQFPQVYPPGPQHVRPPQPTPGSPPGPQPQQPEQHVVYYMGPDKLPYSPAEHPKYPPGDPQSPYVPDPIDPAPTSPPPLPPHPPTQEQIAQPPDYPMYPYPGFQYPQLPQVYPPGPQHVHPPQPTPGSPPGPQPQQPEQHFVYHMGPDKLPYSPSEHPKYPSSPYQPPVMVQAPASPNLIPEQDSSSHQVSELPVGPPQYPSSAYHPYVPFYHAAGTPAPTPADEESTTSPDNQPPKPLASPYYLQYYLHIPYYPTPTDTPVTQPPTPLPPSPLTPPSSPPKQPEGPQSAVGPFYPPVSFSSYYHYGQFPSLIPDLDVQLSSSLHPTIALTSPTSLTITKQPDSPSYPFSQFYPQKPIYFPPLTPPPPAKETPQAIPQEPQRPVVPQATCPPYIHAICSYYPYPYYPYYHPLYPPYYHPHYPPVSQYPQTLPPMTTRKPLTTTTATTTTTTAPTPSPAGPTQQIPHLQCLNGRMVIFLPSAHPDSIQVRDQKKKWLFLSSVSPMCGYMLQMAEGSGVILHSPQPACHSQPRTPTTISLPLRFWDLSVAQYRTLDLQCPYQTTHETLPPVTPSVPSPPPSTGKGKISPPVVPKPKVFCSSHQMTVELPPGPISGIVVKDIKGNQMDLQDAPKHCGYSARKGKDGKIRLTFQLHSRCHMTVQGKMYIVTVIYVTINGRREAQFSCPVVIRVSGQECNLPSEQRLPCGPSSVSQPQCLSMGCCFSKHPPACYYPMDECTIDRHFVFSVPASLTDPPLSPAMLVAASDSTCKPERVTSDYALFKIPMDGCGSRRVMVGKTIIYIVEVINQVQAISLNYGTITRDSPVRLLVECRYMPNTVLSVSYMVKTPTLGPAVQTQGMFGVQLRIAKDAQYSSYHPQYHQPLQMLLGKPLYLEVRLLNTPDPSLVLLVHFCVAYPRSGKAVWLLLYNGCPNPLDPAPQQAVLFDPRLPSPQAQTRRFTISTFQFLPDGEFKDPGEEIYFMCSTEICSPRDGPCVEGCFGR